MPTAGERPRGGRDCTCSVIPDGERFTQCNACRQIVTRLSERPAPLRQLHIPIVIDAKSLPSKRF